MCRANRLRHVRGISGSESRLAPHSEWCSRALAQRGALQLTSYSHFFSSAASSFYACLTWGATRFIRRFQGVTKLISICFLVVASHPVLAQDVALDTLRRETSAVAAVSRGSCSAAVMHQHLPSKQTSGRLISTQVDLSLQYLQVLFQWMSGLQVGSRVRVLRGRQFRDFKERHSPEAH